MSAASESASRRVPLGTLLSWGPPIIGLSSTLFFLQFFFMKYATDVLLLSPALIGTLFAAGRLWDAFSDPIIGTLSDRTKTRMGRRRPWMLAAVPLLIGFMWMSWVPPESLTGNDLTLWVGVSLFGFYTAFTFYMIPHVSLGAELTPDHHDRTRIFGVQSAAFTSGMVFSFGAMQFVMTSDDQRGAAQIVAMCLGVGMLVLLVIPPIRLRERPEFQGRGAQSPLAAMRDVFGNGNAMRLLVVQFTVMIGISVIGLLSPYIVEYVIKRPDMVGPLPALFLIASLASIPIWIRVSKRIGKRDAWAIAMVMAGIGFGLMALAEDESDLLLLACLLPLIGFGNGCGGIVAPSILADIIDGDELDTGERKEGAYNAAFGLALKVANAAMILVTGLVLEALNFQPNVEQPDNVKLGLRLLYGVLPLVMFLMAAAVLRGFKLDEAEHDRIRAELDARAAS
jgi:GPH family glycoside/pentoside/hexuronide:cation symporter